MLRERKNETMTKLGEPNRRGGNCALRFRSYLRRERITCAKTTSYLEHSERKLGTTGKIRKSAGFRRHDAESCRQARMAYNLGNFMRTLALPRPRCGLERQRRSRLVKIGAKVVRHGRYVTFQMAEIARPHDLFQAILRLIDGLRRTALAAA